MSENPYFGQTHTYAGGPLGLRAWGSFYVDNPRRADRLRAAKATACPFCNPPHTGHQREELVFQNHPFVLRPNDFPILRDQRLLFPAEHQTSLNSMMAWLMLEVLAWGLPLFALDRERSRVAMFLNSPGAGQTISHLHVHLIRADAVPWPVAEPGELLYQRGNIRLSQATSLPYFALLLQCPPGPVPGVILHRLAEAQATLQRPWNLLGFPGIKEQVNLLIVPRRDLFCPPVQAHIAGFELLTGIIVRDGDVSRPLTAADRDAAVQLATLDEATATVYLEQILPLLPEFI